MPAASSPRSSVLGRRPTASSRCEPTTSGAPAVQSTLAVTASPCLPTPMHCAFRRTRTPSASRISVTAAEMSGDSRLISRSPVSMSVTWLPKRRYICANSSPM